jgi:hypothetical protein
MNVMKRESLAKAALMRIAGIGNVLVVVKTVPGLSIYQFPRPPTEEVRAGRLGGF